MTSRKIEVKFMQLVHWGPILALSVIFLISAASLRNTLMWWPPSYIGGLINLFIFLSWIVLTLYNYLLAAFKGPGFVPFGWEPVSLHFQHSLMSDMTDNIAISVEWHLLSIICMSTLYPCWVLIQWVERALI